MRHLCHLLCLLPLLFYSHCFALEDFNMDTLYPAARPSVVILYCFDESDKVIGTGTGFFVSSHGQLLTCYHVIEGAYRVDLKTESGKHFPVAGILEVDPESDLALLQAELDDTPALQVTQSFPIPLGSKLAIIGNPLGKEGVATEGRLTAKGSWEKNRNLVVSAPVAPGSSGSPVINYRGEVIGVTKAMEISSRPVSFVSPGELARAMLARHTEGTVEKPQPFNTVDWGTEYKYKIDPDYQDAAMSLAAGNYKKALEQLNKVLDRYPNNPDVLFRLGSAHLSLQNFDKALECFKQTIQLDPKHVWAWTRLGQTYYYKKDFDAAIDAYLQGNKLEQDLYETWANLGLAYAAKNSAWDAVYAFEKASELNPEDSVTFRAIGQCYSFLNQLDKATRAFERATELSPADLMSLQMLADCYGRAGKPDRKWQVEQQLHQLQSKN